MAIVNGIEENTKNKKPVVALEHLYKKTLDVHMDGSKTFVYPAGFTKENTFVLSARIVTAGYTDYAGEWVEGTTYPAWTGADIGLNIVCKTYGIEVWHNQPQSYTIEILLMKYE